MIVRRLVDGVDERLDGTSFIKRNLRKVFPDHWSFMLGELALYSFVMLLLTGTFLSLFFVASPAETVYRGPYLPLQGRDVSLAYESVLRISFEVRAGLVMFGTWSRVGRGRRIVWVWGFEVLGEAMEQYGELLTVALGPLRGCCGDQRATSRPDPVEYFGPLAGQLERADCPSV